MSGILRARLSEWQPLSSVDFGESRTAMATMEMVGQLVVGLPIHRPSPDCLQSLRTTLANARREGLLPSQWSLTLLRASGWIMLDVNPLGDTAAATDPSSQCTAPIDDPVLFSNYLSALAERGGVLGGRILLNSYLRLYPSGRPCLEPLRTTLIQLLTQGTGNAARVRRAAVRHGLLAPNGPALLARHLLETDPGPYLATIGLTGELSRSRFVEAAWEYLAAEVASFHSVGEGGAVAHGFGAALRVLLALSLDNSGAELRFPARAIDLAEAILAPWVGRGTELPAGIRNLLFTHLGDFRGLDTAWERVSEPSRKVMGQYLAGEVLEHFFGLLEIISARDSAVDRYRQQRRVLWEFCRAQGVLTDAWIAIGPSLLPEAMRSLGPCARRYAGLGTTTGARARHVALLLRIAGVSVVEWSHVGPYYLWHPTNMEAPRLYQPHYSYESLERGVNLIRPHHDDSRGDWRSDFLHHLTTITGVHLDAPFL
ncbi:hypothetical protein CCP3SC1_250019 [Gammaproteobacteria bacterium]